jgi:hypothetical protein
MQAIKSENGDSFGRAALDLDAVLDSHKFRRGCISVGGIVSQSAGGHLRTDLKVEIPYFGVVEGQAERAARDYSSIIAPQSAIRAWLDYQLTNLDRNVLRKSEQMHVASFALASTGSDVGLPFAFIGGQLRTVTEVTSLAMRFSKFYVPITWRYESWPEVIGYNLLRPEYFEASMAEEVVVLAAGSDRFIPEDKAKQLKKEGGGILNREEIFQTWNESRTFIEHIEKVWGSESSFSLMLHPIFSTNIASLAGERWVVCISRAS